MDFFAYIKFHFNKEECWKKVSDIKEKKYNKNGNVEMSPFDPKTISDFTANKWYFAKWDSEDVQTIRWSKINILYVADKEDENLKHVRKRYTNAKVIESESSFEEENEFNESQKKMKILKKNKAVVSEERALNVLQKLKKSFKPLAFVDNDFEDNVSIASSTKNQNVTVLIERMDDKVLRNVTNFSNICSKSVTTLASELSRKKCNAKSSAPQRSDSISSILEELTDCFDGKNLKKDYPRKVRSRQGHYQNRIVILHVDRLVHADLGLHRYAEPDLCLCCQTSAGHGLHRHIATGLGLDRIVGVDLDQNHFIVTVHLWNPIVNMDLHLRHHASVNLCVDRHAEPDLYLIHQVNTSLGLHRHITTGLGLDRLVRVDLDPNYFIIGLIRCLINHNLRVHHHVSKQLTLQMHGCRSLLKTTGSK